MISTSTPEGSSSLRSASTVFEDVAEPGRFVETFLVESWIEHLRQHERVTKADEMLQARIEPFLLQPAKVTHLIAAEPAPTDTRHV